MKERMKKRKKIKDKKETWKERDGGREEKAMKTSFLS